MSKAENYKTGKLLVFLSIVMLVAFLMNLGFWQLDRAEQKEQLLAQWNTPAKQIQKLEAESVNFYKKVAVKGKIAIENYYLLDNKIRDGKVGYEILTVLSLENGQRILINLGWLKANIDRNILPRIELPIGDILIKGWIKKVERVFQLEKDNWSISWPKRIQQIDIDKMFTEDGIKIAALVLLVDQPLLNKLKTDWKPVNMSVQKHIGYAFQWFLMALCLCFMTGWFMFTNKRNRAEP